jgi:DNA polymerase-3 subunit gamma/tau
MATRKRATKSEEAVKGAGQAAAGLEFAEPPSAEKHAGEKQAGKSPPFSTSQGTPEGYTVLARRYRPRQFAEVIGQEPVAQALVNALESNRVAHAYLFTGARGVGKTSMARILAKALNCVRGPTTKPCDQCDICQAIATGDDVDVVEIDGASNRQIDDVREIRQNVQYRPNRARFKIYIIDEVHMLTKEAFNALLKTLEEPPPHVKFIFATTDVHKVPVTILSRCQRFDFAGIGMAGIVDRLRQIVATEKMTADNDALELIARRAGGSMRDAQSLLDQLLAFGGQKLSSEQVHHLLGTAPDDRIIDLASAVLERNPKRVLNLLDEAEKEGLQLGEFLEQLLDYWRDLMVVHCAGAEAKALSVSSRHGEILARQAASQSLETILAGLDILSSAKSRLRGSSHARTLMEMALVRLSRLDDLRSVSELVQSLAGSAGEKAAPTGSQAIAAPQRQRLSDTLPPKAETRTMPSARFVASPNRDNATAPLEAPLAGANLTLTAGSLPQIWPVILQQIPGILAMALEKASVPAISGPNTLVIRFPSEYNTFRKHFLEGAGVEKLTGALRSSCNAMWHVQVELAEASAPQRAPGTGETTDAPASRSRQDREEEALKEPLVKRVKDVFKASFGSVDEGFGGAAGETAARVDPEETEEA